MPAYLHPLVHFEHGGFCGDRNLSLVIEQHGILCDDGLGREKRKSLWNAVISRHESKTGKSLQRETRIWGMEGETDVCFHLKELDASEQRVLIMELRGTIQTGCIRFLTDARCKGTGRP